MCVNVCEFVCDRKSLGVAACNRAARRAAEDGKRAESEMRANGTEEGRYRAEEGEGGRERSRTRMGEGRGHEGS